MKDVKISYRENWGLRHWRTIHDAYRRSPWFEHYARGLEKLFEKRPAYLLEWNRATMEWALGHLNWEGQIGVTDRFEAAYTEDGTVDGRRKYCSEPMPADEVPYRYTQVFSDRHDFIGNLSILDLLFCEGPGAKGILEGASPV